MAITFPETEPLLETPLGGLHRSLGARLVPFAGYAMPVQYPAGILTEHLHTRAQAGLFDVSHMGQAELLGAGAATALERLTPADVEGLQPGRQRYALLTTESGGIFDDFMVANLGSRLFLVVNASRKAEDFARIAAALPAGVRLNPLPDRALLALQGPQAVAAITPLAPELATLRFMDVAEARIGGIPVLASRSGYTGEDGFEISIEGADAERVARALLAEEEVLPIGLGARDSLRLEAGLCLYGHDMDESTDPVEASLVWAIGKRRMLEKGFPSADAIMAKVANGTAKKRVGIKPEGRAPAREGTEIMAGGRIIGRVTSGGFGPSANGPVAMGYVESAFAADGTKIELMVRGQALPATVAPMPFVPNTYKR